MKIIALKLLQASPENIIDISRFKNIVKGLKTDEPYYLYKNYELSADNQLIKLKENNLPFIDNFDNPLQKGNKLPINVCAIVGKNGSGKSSIIELIIRIINNFASSIIGDLPIFNSAHPLHFIPDIFAEIYYEINGSFYKISQYGNNIYMYKSGQDSYVYENRHDGYQWCHYKTTPILKESELNQLFYSVVVNYSHYSYNLYDFRPEWSSTELMKNKLNLPKEEVQKRKEKGQPEIFDIEKCWLTGIFHKNDGYQTPIVLNPYRYDGNINIADEGELEKDRLLSLILSLDYNQQNILTEIIEKKTVQSIDIVENLGHITIEGEKYKTKKLEGFYQQITNAGVDFTEVYNEIICQWSKLYGIDFSLNLHNDVHEDLNELALNYLVYKTLRITWQYNNYAFFYSDMIHKGRSLPSLINDLVKAINEDRSHITLKIRQTICHLLCHHLIPGYKQSILHIGQRIEQALKSILKQNIPFFQQQTIKKSTDTLKLNASDRGGCVNFNPTVIDMLPPPFFKIEMNLIDTKTKEIFTFNTLSSGEKQMIYTIGTILYHLKNVDSVRERHESDDVYYEHINIILEEIELYYHPEMQRKLISYILNSIKKLNLNTKSIQIILVTHSPFVLSDIPGNNVLYLDKGKPCNTHNRESFGANIFELLKDCFYLENGPVGAHSYQIMTEMFRKINTKRLSKKDFEAIKQMVPHIGEPFLQNELIKLIKTKEIEYATNKNKRPERI